jgi:hypothetical protein
MKVLIIIEILEINKEEKKRNKREILKVACLVYLKHLFPEI